MMKEDTLYENSVRTLVEHYASLVAHAEKVIFAPLNLKFADWPDLENRPRWQSILLNIIFPYGPLNDGIKPKAQIFQYFIIFVWLFYVRLWLIVGQNLLNPLSAQPADNVSVWLVPIFIILIIPFFLLMPVPYIQLIWFLFSKKNSLMTRFLGVIGMIFFVGAIYWYGQNYDPDSLVKISLTNSAAFFILFGLLIPVYISLFWLAAFTFMMISQLILNSLTAILRSARPLALQDISKLALKPIQGSGKSWLLRDLSLEEISTLRFWSEQNSEANEKKTVPNVVVMALLALLVGAPFVQNFLNTILQSITQLLMNAIWPQVHTTMTEFFVGYILLMSVVMFLASQVTHFRNFTIQGVIRQACTVAEYAKKQEMVHLAQKHDKPNPFFYLLDRLLSFFCNVTEKN